MKNLEGKKFAIPKICLDMDLNERVGSEFEKAIKILRDNGAEVDEYDIDSLNHTIETYNILVNGEIASNMARFDSIRYGHRTDKNFENIEEMYRASRSEGFGDEVKRRIMIGTHILSMIMQMSIIIRL
ncbi:amidase family protein [Peptoniphilus harei]|nr:amidase family protein [Peptoniphilus harei]